MPQELTLETLAKNMDSINLKLAAVLKADHEEDDKAKDAKKAQDDKDDDEKKEAKRASRIAAVKKAMEEPTDEKKDAAIRKAMDDDEPKDHTAQDDEDDKKEAKKAQDDKDDKEHVASIIEDSKQSYIKKILTASNIFNPQGVKALEKKLKTASIKEVKNHWSILSPAFEGAVQTPAAEKPFVPFYASGNEGIDNSQLNASSPDSDFGKLSTKELLEMYR